MNDGFMRCINRTARCAKIFRGYAMAHLGLEGNQHTYILNICRNPGISQDGLAKIIYINKSNVTRQLTVLEQNGFIKREPDKDDKRIMRVYPTQKAEEAAPQILDILGEWNKYITETLTPEEKAQFGNALEKVMYRAMEWVDRNTPGDNK